MKSSKPAWDWSVNTGLRQILRERSLPSIPCARLRSGTSPTAVSARLLHAPRRLAGTLAGMPRISARRDLHDGISPWQETQAELPARDALRRDRECDVLVVGAGIS